MSFEMLKKFLSYIVSKEQLFDTLKYIYEAESMASAIDFLVDRDTNDLSEFLILFRKIAEAYLQTSYLEKNGNKLDTTEKICDYFEISFLGVKNEEIHAIGLDDELYIICEATLNIGSPSKVAFSLRQFADFVIRNNLSLIVIAHNHPNGICYPSEEDIVCTQKLVEFLDVIDTELIDHIVVGRGGAHSIRSSLKGCEIWNKY